MTPPTWADLMAEADRERREAAGRAQARPPRPAPTPEQLEMLPEFMRDDMHRLHRFATGADTENEYGKHADPAGDAPIEEADLISSRLNIAAGAFGEDSWHRPILDLDFGAAVVPSTTWGHYHLYLDHLVTWESYVKLLEALAECGIIEQGYADASIERGYTSLRLPWVRKNRGEE